MAALCCPCWWPFADVWLEDVEPARQHRKHSKHSSSSRSKSSGRRTEVARTESGTVETGHRKSARPEKRTTKVDRVGSLQSCIIRSQILDNSSLAAMSGTRISNNDPDSDYEHWPDDATSVSDCSATSTGYDSDNGSFTHIYKPAKTSPPTVPRSPSGREQKPAAQGETASEMVPPSGPQPVYAMAYPMMQYAYEQQPQPQMVPVAYPVAPAYFTYAPPQLPQVPMAKLERPAKPEPISNEFVYKAPVDAPKANEWIGRTKTQVQEDNMKLAAREGAYDKRKVVPAGVKNDQMCWVVELDGSQTLRSFTSIRGLNGTWKKDPRFDEAYYFVRKEPKSMS